MSLQKDCERLHEAWIAFVGSVIEAFRIKQLLKWITKKLERMY
jgi:hypothetical protein